MSRQNLLWEHLGSVLLVSLVMLLLFFTQRPHRVVQSGFPDEVRTLAEMNVDAQDSFQSQLFDDFARTLAGKDSASFLRLWRQFKKFNRAQMQVAETQFRQRMANRRSFAELLTMYFNFILIYLIVMAVTYYGVQTLGIYFFVRKKQGHPLPLVVLLQALRRVVENSTWVNIRHLLRLGLQYFAAFLGYLILFSPAYVIAYSIKSDFNTESVLFMILLGVISNAVLITYANKFYHLLLNESRKGYVRTAIVKNLESNYRLGSTGALRWKQLLALRKNFDGHVLQHIFMNARYQYLATFKEQAAFLITGLIIIEMALNIHEHLSYELLQQLLYKNYDLVVLIVWGIFLLVKATEFFTDWLLLRWEKRLGAQ